MTRKQASEPRKLISPDFLKELANQFSGFGFREQAFHAHDFTTIHEILDKM